MANNTSQIFTKKPRINWCVLTAANTAYDGTGTVGTCFTAGGADDSRIERIRFQPQGSNAASAASIFVNNGSTNATASNNILLCDLSLPVTVASNVGAILSSPVEIPIAADLNALFPNGLPNGYKINIALRSSVLGGWAITGLGGDYS